MRLLNTSSLELESFEAKAPRYAILSHRWGAAAEEILYDDARHGRDHLLASSKKGLAKVVNSCARAFEDNYDYIWIDTCCIDKSSSSELSEAINSMFEWYRASEVCYAYLDDVSQDDASTGMDHSDGAVYWQQLRADIGWQGPLSTLWIIMQSRWFTRGWSKCLGGGLTGTWVSLANRSSALQELLAPFDVRFYDVEWNFIGDRIQLAKIIYVRTNIYEGILQRHLPGDCSAGDVNKECNWCNKCHSSMDIPNNSPNPKDV